MKRRSLLRDGFALLAVAGSPASALAGAQTAADVSSNPWAHPTLLALLDTVVPGPLSDPSGGPGAVEAGTLQFLLEAETEGLLGIPFALVRRVLQTSLEARARRRHRAPFHTLDLASRTDIVASFLHIQGVPQVLRFMRGPFYAGIVNHTGFDYAGYPGPGRIYADFSHGDMTARAHPRSTDGNLP